MDNLSEICYNDNIMMDNGVTGDDIIMNSSGSTRSAKKGHHGNGRSKLARLDQAELKHSTDSLLSTMERFVQTVDDMNETILVPCRLMDAKFELPSGQEGPVATLSHDESTAGGEKRLLKNLNGIDLHQFYTMLNTVKSDLMWGNKSQNGISNYNHSPLSTPPAQPLQTQTVEIKGHVRRPSTVSTTSSTSASDTEFSELNEDSGVEAEEEYVQQMADSFHHHLDGLQHCLRDLTLAADYVTNRYDTDLGGLNI